MSRAKYSVSASSSGGLASAASSSSSTLAAGSPRARPRRAAAWAGRSPRRRCGRRAGRARRPGASGARRRGRRSGGRRSSRPARGRGRARPGRPPRSVASSPAAVPITIRAGSCTPKLAARACRLRGLPPPSRISSSRAARSACSWSRASSDRRSVAASSGTAAWAAGRARRAVWRPRLVIASQPAGPIGTATTCQPVVLELALGEPLAERARGPASRRPPPRTRPRRRAAARRRRASARGGRPSPARGLASRSASTRWRWIAVRRW